MELKIGQRYTRFGETKREWLEGFLDLTEGIPSHDTFSRVFSLLDSSAFARHFMRWVETLMDKVKKVLAIDGKSMRGTRSISKNLSALHLVNVWCCENRLVLGQEVVADKSNEITAIPHLLDLLDVKEAIITMDAMGCQKDFCEKIREKKADYVLCLKGNQGNLHKDVELYFKSIIEGKIRREPYCYQSIEKDHGRIEERAYQSVALPDGIRSEG